MNFNRGARHLFFNGYFSGEERGKVKKKKLVLCRFYTMLFIAEKKFTRLQIWQFFPEIHKVNDKLTHCQTISTTRFSHRILEDLTLKRLIVVVPRLVV